MEVYSIIGIIVCLIFDYYLFKGRKESRYRPPLSQRISPTFFLLLFLGLLFLGFSVLSFVLDILWSGLLLLVISLTFFIIVFI